MRKFLLIMLAVLSAIVLACGVTACDDGSNTPAEYNVTFNLNYENSPAVTVLKTKNGEVQYIEEPTRSGYEFVEWCKDAEGTQPFAGGKITSNITLYAKWEKEKATFTVTYMVGGEIYQTAQAQEGDTVKLIPYTADVDKRFEGWTLDGQTYAVGASYTVSSNVTFTAALTQLYSVTYIAKDEVVKIEYVARGEQVILPTAEELSLVGRFLGWELVGGGEPFYGGYVYTLDTADDLVFYASFEGAYVLSFSLGYETEGASGLPADAEYANGDVIKLPAAPERAGYRFDGWYDGNTLYDAEANYTMPASAVTITAQWIKTYTVTFYYNYEGAGVYHSEVVDENSRVSQPENPSRAEHKFVNWYADSMLESTFRFTSRINEDTEVYAGWQHNYLNFTLTPEGDGYFISHAGSPDFTGVPRNSNLVIPKTYNGLPVVSVDPVAFSSDGHGHVYGSMGPLWRLFTINNSGLNSPFISITIPNTWTEIPDGMFGSCSSTLYNVYFEEGTVITRIGLYAFYSCRVLERFDMPSTVTEIGEGAFSGCEALTSMDLSACTIKEIPYAAFRNCFDMLSFKFPKGLEIIGEEAFHSAFIYRTGDMAYRDDAEMNELLNNRPNLDKGTTFVDLVIPEGVTYIGMWAFSNETGINDMENDPADTLYDDLWVNYSRWGQGGVNYFNFYYSHLRSVVIPSTCTYLGRGAFAWCENLTSVEFKSGFSDDTLRDYMFFGAGLEKAVFPEGIKNIEKAAFMRCDDLKSVAIPSTVQYIGRRVFAYTANLETVTFAPGIKDLKLYYIGQYSNGDLVLVDSGAMFDHSGIKSIQIPACVELLPQLMFQSCERLTTVTFEEGTKLTNIRPYAFMNSGLTAIDLPDTIETIGAQAFANTQLKEIYIPANLSNGDLSTGTSGGDANKFGWYAFADNKKLEKITFAPNCKLEVLSFRVFENCTALTEVILSNNLRSVNGTYAKTAYDNPETKDVVEGTIWTSNAFVGCTALEKITVPAENPYIKAVGYALYSRTSTEGEYVNLDWYSQAEVAGGEVTVKEGIEVLCEYVFSENKFITKLNLPASLKVVGIRACGTMTSLEEVVFAEGSQLEEIGNYAFGNITTYPTIISDTGFESTNYNEPPIKTPFVKIVFTGATAPKIGANIFVWSLENPDFAIYVPAESVDAYKTGFSAFAQYIKAIEE